MTRARIFEPEVAVTAALPGAALDRLAGRCTVRVRPERTVLDESALAAFIGSADAAITLLADPVTEAVLSACPALRIVANYAVGYDNVDLDAARERGIWVTNTPDVLTEATADFTWALILAVTRRIVEGDGVMRRGEFHGWRPDLMLGRGLQGKILGIVGYGRIGRAVARRGLVFGMDVAATSRHPFPEDEAPVRFLPLEELLAASDVVTLHCPLTPETHHLLDRRRLSLLPAGAYVINTSRGPVVDEAALVDVLETGRLGGAALDVYEREPEVHPGLPGRRDVVLAPHLGSATEEARAAMADVAVANVDAVLEGREPPNPLVRGAG